MNTTVNTLKRSGQASKVGGSGEEQRGKERREKIQQYHEYCDCILCTSSKFTFNDILRF